MRVVFIAAALLSVLVWCTPSRSTAQTDEYTLTIGEALSLLAADRWQEAYTLMQRAHALRPSARTYRGLGMAAFGMGHYREAAAHLQASLADTRHPLTPELRTEVEAMRVECVARIGSLRVILNPASATATLDGHQVTSGSTVPVDPGRHALRVDAAGYSGHAEELLVAAGEQRAVEVTLRPVATVPAPSPGPDAQAQADAAATARPGQGAPMQAPEATDDPAHATTRSAAFGVGAGAVALGTSSLLLGVVSHALRNDAGSAFDASVRLGTCVAVDADGNLPDQPDPRCTDWHRRRTNLKAPMIAGYVGGAALIGVGVVLMLTSGRSGDSDERAVTCGAGPGDVGVSCGARF